MDGGVDGAAVVGGVIAVALWDVVPSRARNHLRAQCLVSRGAKMSTDAPAKESVPMISVSELKMLRIMNVSL
jgi:hypothetical protein